MCRERHMSFPVVVILEVFTDDAGEQSGIPLSFFRELRLPFAPFIGLALHQDGWWCGPLEQVEWHETLSGFICRVAPDDALVREYRSKGDRPPAREQSEFYKDMGWHPLVQGESYPELLRNR